MSRVDGGGANRFSPSPHYRDGPGFHHDDVARLRDSDDCDPEDGFLAARFLSKVSKAVDTTTLVNKPSSTVAVNFDIVPPSIDIQQTVRQRVGGIVQFCISRNVSCTQGMCMSGSAGVRDGALSTTSLKTDRIQRLYAQCASFYDQLCGPMLQAGRREAMRDLRLRPGQETLEIGIGTALTAPLYPRDCQVTGIDLSAPMLREAVKHLGSRHGQNIRLLQMDASNLGFSNESFDVVYAAYVISVVPDPVAVLCEMRRVCRVGGDIVLLNHFLSDSPFLAKAERLISPLTTQRLGFRADLHAQRLLAQSQLRPVSIRKVNKPPIWTLIRCRRDY